jgi:hypothetical protein
MHNRQIVVVSLVTQCVYDHICLPRVVVHFQLIVHDQLEPSSLPQIKIRLGKDLLQALVVCIDVNHIPNQIMSPCPQCHYHDCQLKIMSRIALLMAFQLL